MPAGICGKRVGSEDVFGSPPSAKRSRCSPFGSPTGFPESGPESDSRISALLRMFPSLDRQVVESALDSNDQKIDDAVQALRTLCRGNDCRTHETLSVNAAVTSNEGGISTQLFKENAEEFQNGCPEELRSVSSWVDLLVREIMSAAGWDDVRDRTIKFLEAFERSVLAHTTTSKEQEIASLKEQLQCFLKDNHILKRGVAIQHERDMEREEKLKEIPHLKQIISQCQEQLRKLEMDNYALKFHLQRSQQSSSFPAHFNPDIF
ncbi:Uncharacterized protein M6B38_222370 [Iris pallida]|uniref:CUE domain-containing protein n=1 Tax=Iris pallida TaxID=29817 RepID=A0AAX6DWN3_IRIPA|nr:Uncharacterized protein M6B38_222370 [Iris pallida]